MDDKPKTAFRVSQQSQNALWSLTINTSLDLDTWV